MKASEAPGPSFLHWDGLADQVAAATLAQTSATVEKDLSQMQVYLQEKQEFHDRQV